MRLEGDDEVASGDSLCIPCSVVRNGANQANTVRKSRGKWKVGNVDGKSPNGCLDRTGYQ